MGHIKLKSILAENMRRFRIKNLNEEYLKDLAKFHFLFKYFIEEAISIQSVSEVFLKFL